MARVIVGMTISLDGFVEDANGRSEALYPDLEALHGTPYMDELIAETGAVIMGRRSYEMADDPDWLVGNYEFQCPIFVMTHHPPETPPKQDERLTFTYVTDGPESAVRQATAVAGAAGKAVTVVGGASVTQQLLRAGLATDFRIDVMPVILGAGLRLLDGPGLDGVRLEKIGVVEVGERTSLRYRIVK